jgi:hypothetical protein
MSLLPKWKVDLELKFISEDVGRGIFALRAFKKGDVIGIYDGNRCDKITGEVVIARDHLTTMYLENNINLKYKSTHAVLVGQKQVTSPPSWRSTYTTMLASPPSAFEDE